MSRASVTLFPVRLAGILSTRLGYVITLHYKTTFGQGWGTSGSRMTVRNAVTQWLVALVIALGQWMVVLHVYEHDLHSDTSECHACVVGQHLNDVAAHSAVPVPSPAASSLVRAAGSYHLEPPHHRTYRARAPPSLLS